MSHKYKHHKYTWTNFAGSIQHRWEFVGALGGISFNVHLTDGYDPSAGLEFHHTSGNGAPDHVDCRVTGGRCWHDGISMYATESVWPAVKGMCAVGAHDKVFRYLEHIADEHFEPAEDTP